MASGKFEAIAYEEKSLRDPSLALPLVGVLQVFVFLGLDGYLLAPYARLCSSCYYQECFNACFPWWVPIFINAFLVSLLVMVASFVALGVWRLKRVPPGNCEFTFDDRRDVGGVLTLSYANSKGKKRDSLAVTKVKAFANRPLMRTRGKFEVPVEGTESSMDISFKGAHFGLFLGFPDPNSMDDAYERLKDYGAPRLEEAVLKRPLGMPPHLIRHMAYVELGVYLVAALLFYGATVFPSRWEVLAGFGLNITLIASAFLAVTILGLRTQRTIGRATQKEEAEDKQENEEAEQLRKRYREEHPELN